MSLCGDDLLIWADGTYCYRHELDEYGWMSDDFTVVEFGSTEYLQFTEEELG